MRRELGIWGQAGGRHRGLREKGRFDLPVADIKGLLFVLLEKRSVWHVGAEAAGGPGEVSAMPRMSPTRRRRVPHAAEGRPARPIHFDVKGGRRLQLPDCTGPVWPPRIKRARVARGQRVTGPAQALATVTRPSRDGEEKPSDCRCPKQPAHLHGMAAFSKQDVLQVTLRTLRDGLRPYPPLRTPPRPSARSSLHTPPAGITPSVPWALGGG